MSEAQGYTQAFVDIMNSQLAQDITNAFAEGEKAERERIVKLLREHPVGIDITDSPMCDGCWDTDYDKHLIALIKGEGENK